MSTFLDENTKIFQVPNSMLQGVTLMNINLLISLSILLFSVLCFADNCSPFWRFSLDHCIFKLFLQMKLVCIAKLGPGFTTSYSWSFIVFAILWVDPSVHYIFQWFVAFIVIFNFFFILLYRGRKRLCFKWDDSQINER